MNFPHIEHIDQVLPCLEGRDEFVVANKGAYTVIDYRYALIDSFDDPIRRECRGLKFAPDGRLIARPLHKFFNYGEKPETQLNGGVLDFSDPHVIMEKMDGSMIHPCIVDVDGLSYNGIRFMTRMGVTDVAKQAERLLTERLADLLAYMLDVGLTPIFEYVGPENRIVEAYAEPELVLLQIRNTATGQYADLTALQDFAALLGVRLAPTYPAFSKHEDILAVYERTQGEGVVMKFDKGLFVKIKTEEYRRLHRLRDDVSREHDLARVVIDGGIDDAMPLFDDYTRRKVEDFSAALLKGIAKSVLEVRSLVLTGIDLDQKTFATEHLKNAPGPVRTCAFTVRKLLQADGIADANDVVREFVIKATANAKAFDAIRDFCGGARFEGTAWMAEAA